MDSPAKLLLVMLALVEPMPTSAAPCVPQPVQERTTLNLLSNEGEPQLLVVKKKCRIENFVFFELDDALLPHVVVRSADATADQVARSAWSALRGEPQDIFDALSRLRFDQIAMLMPRRTPFPRVEYSDSERELIDSIKVVSTRRMRGSELSRVVSCLDLIRSGYLPNALELREGKYFLDCMEPGSQQDVTRVTVEATSEGLAVTDAGSAAICTFVQSRE